MPRKGQTSPSEPRATESFHPSVMRSGNNLAGRTATERCDPRGCRHHCRRVRTKDDTDCETRLARDSIVLICNALRQTAAVGLRRFEPPSDSARFAQHPVTTTFVTNTVDSPKLRSPAAGNSRLASPRHVQSLIS